MDPATLIADLLPQAVSPLLAAFLILASFFTSALTAAFGLGGGIAMVAILGATIPIAAVIPVHGVVQLGSNAGRAWHMRQHLHTAVLAPFFAGVIVGAILGGLVAVDIPEPVLRISIGVFIVLFVWLPLPKPDSVSRKAMVFGGVVTMFLNMLFGATGPLVSTLFSRVFSVRQQLVASVAAAMTAQNTTKIIVFGLLGFAFHQWIWLALAMVATGYLGTITGARLLNTIPETQFRIAFKIGLSLLALDMIRRGIQALA